MNLISDAKYLLNTCTVICSHKSIELIRFYAEYKIVNFSLSKKNNLFIPYILYRLLVVINVSFRILCSNDSYRDLSSCPVYPKWSCLSTVHSIKRLQGADVRFRKSNFYQGSWVDTTATGRSMKHAIGNFGHLLIAGTIAAISLHATHHLYQMLQVAYKVNPWVRLHCKCC